MLQQENATDDLSELVTDLLYEVSKFDANDSRKDVREPFMSCVSINNSIEKIEFSGFSRNISPTGIGLVTMEEIPISTKATLGIARVNGKTTKILAVCRWSKPYGRDWYSSGWEFLQLIGNRMF